MLDQYPEYPDVDTMMVDEPMETAFEDLDYFIGNAMAYECLDIDNDGFAQLDSLFWRLTIEDYDTVNPLEFRLRIYVKEIGGQEFYITQTDAFYQQSGTTLWWYTLSPGWHEDLFDFRLELLSSTGEIVATVPYDHFSGLIDLPMELWIEDSPLTMVFDPNPIVTLNDYYYIDVDTLMDHGDSVYPAMINALQPRDLLGLTPDFYNVYYLDGPFVAVGDWQPAATQQAASVGDAVFPYYRCEPQFEEVMCYYHIDRSQRYLQSLGFMNACNRAIEVDPHGLGEDTLAYYQPNIYGTGYLLFGNGGIDFAEDADIILHEYGHAIQDNQAPLIYSNGNGDIGFGNETIFMAEGFAFYWAASMTDSMSEVNNINSGWWGEWAVKGSAPYASYMYTLDNDKLYPDNLTFDPDRKHEDGAIWGGALWDIFEEFGRKITDSLVLRSHELMFSDQIEDPTFEDGAIALLQADVPAYGGIHYVALYDILSTRGFLPELDCFCGMKGDMNNDGGTTPLDVQFLLKFVYKQLDGRIYPDGWNCPYDLGDLDCDGQIGPVDLQYLVQFVYKSRDLICEPCTW
jgi:hypothetical protein